MGKLNLLKLSMFLTNDFTLRLEIPNLVGEKLFTVLQVSSKDSRVSLRI